MQTIRLQSIGHVKAIAAGELTVNQITVWNFGYTEIIVKKLKETAKTIWFTIQSESGDFSTRRFSKTRLVAISTK